MRKFWRAVAACLVLTMALTGCGKKEEPKKDLDLSIEEEPKAEPEEPREPEQPSEPEEPSVPVLSELEAEITWWTYPIFVQEEGAAQTYEQQLIARFQQYYPNIQVYVEVLDYENGPARVEEAIRGWFNGKLLGQRILRAKLGEIVYHCEGVANYSVTTPAADVAVQEDQLPLLGRLTVEAKT